MSERSKRSSTRPFDDPFAEELAWLMDSAIHIGPFTIGLDGLIGLIPGAGDAIASFLGAWIVLRAMQNGVSRPAILRMLLNLGIDSAVGSVPIVGDFFDFAHKANSRNLRIYRESLDGERKPLRDWIFISIVIVVLLAMIVLPIFGLIFLVKLFTS